MEGSGSGLAQALETDDQQDSRGEKTGRDGEEDDVVHVIPFDSVTSFLSVAHEMRDEDAAADDRDVEHQDHEQPVKERHVQSWKSSKPSATSMHLTAR
jgi:hypothetical protein